MKNSTRYLALALSLTATAVAGTAYGEQTGRRFDGRAALTRSEVQTHSTAMFARLDANKDGKIDPVDREARRNARFDRLDTDRNGQLSRAEFGTRARRVEGEGRPHRGTMHRGGRGPGRGMTGGLADADKDGAVTQAEFTAAALRHFDRIDADKDGQATSEERRAARKAMRHEWRAKRDAAPPTTPGT